MGKREHERHSGSGLKGDPKKGGFGGKGTWEGDGSENPAPMDPEDPNYEPAEVESPAVGEKESEKSE